MKIRALPSWNGFVPEWIEERGAVWLSRRDRLFRASAIESTPEEVGRVPTPGWRRLAAALPLGARFLRFAFYNVVPLPGGDLFASFDRGMWRFTRKRWHPVRGTLRPARILRGGCATTSDGSVFFGEYVSNPNRSETIHLYRLPPDSDTAEVVQAFEPGTLRHIHSVRRDPFTDELWLCSGDHPLECRILASSDGFTTTRVVGEGDESWRAIHPIFTPKQIFYATDSEFAQNRIYSISRADGTRQTVTEIDGPSYYGAVMTQAALFATTAELCPSQSEPAASLWSVSADAKTQRFADYRKDLFGSKFLATLFQPGIVLFPGQFEGCSTIPFTGTGLSGLQGRMFAITAV